MSGYTPIRILPGEGIEVLDQTLLPHEERYLRLDTVAGVAEAIRSLRVRGAPLLGVTGACGMAIAGEERGVGPEALEQAASELKATRPTAVDLGAMIDEALAAVGEAGTEGERRAALWGFAERALARQRERDAALARHGRELPGLEGAVLTHCNTGGLATGGEGTALAVIAEAWRSGRIERCYATETRPLLQGARLTMWELGALGIPGTLLPDTAAASLIASGQVSAVITGADRIAANGDGANKVGTYGLAAVAARHGVPFYLAAPLSTFDANTPSGEAIPIEFRGEDEVGGFGDDRWSPEGGGVYNPAFDVTPAELIAGIVCESGVLRPPYGPAIAALTAQNVDG
ncbi:MAG: S-methyl-5-thioribose-1-phosphate isomerase [Chloroflexi bacterium]|nr:S-methyl-5-thioribose-1-phosphate isomerase [Chloroflexota bacterium]